ncbi:MAG: hypothetical protein ACYC5Y_08575 [Symbiobacteriia bacterium]
MPNLAAAEVLSLSQIVKANQSMVHLCNHFANETSDPELKQLCQTLIQDHDSAFHKLASHLGTATH